MQNFPNDNNSIEASVMLKIIAKNALVKKKGWECKFTKLYVRVIHHTQYVKIVFIEHSKR